MPKRKNTTTDRKGNPVSYFSFGMEPSMSDLLDEISATKRMSKKDLVIMAVNEFLDKIIHENPEGSPAKLYAAFDDFEKLKEQVHNLEEQQAYMRKMLDTIFMKSDFTSKT